MANPLVEQREDSTQAFSGVPILESADETKKAIESGDWAAGVMGAAGAGLDALGMAMDPFGAVLAAGVGWLMEHVGPVSDALDSLTGDADEIKAHSETWKNVAAELSDIGADMTNLVETDTAGWVGEAGDAYRRRSEDIAKLLAAAKSAADGAASGVGRAGEVVGAVRTMVRDIIAELVGHLVSWALQVVATLGIGLSWVVPQVVAEVAKVAARIADLTTKLVKAIKSLAPMLSKLGSSFGDARKALDEIKGDGGKPPPPKGPPGPGSTSSQGADAPPPKGPDNTGPQSADPKPDGGGPPAPGPSSPDGNSPAAANPGGGPGSGSRGGPGPGKSDPGKSDVDGGPPGGQRTDGNRGCDGKGGDPVDAVSGQVIANGVDLDLPGLLPLVLQRAYASGHPGGGLHGPGWSSTLDQRLEVDRDTVRYFGDDAQILHYERPDHADLRRMPQAGARWPLSWDQGTDTYRIEDPKTGWVRHFGPAEDRRRRPITALTDRNGNRVDYVREHSGVPAQVVHSGGYRVRVEHAEGPAGPRVTGLRLAADDTALTDAALIEYRYDPHGRLTEILDETRLPYRYEYDDAGRITAWIDREGYRYSYVYGPDGRVVRSEGDGGYLSARFDYDLGARATTVTDSLGNATVFHYDEHEHLTAVVDPLGNAELTEYDRFHRLLSRTDALGNTTRFTLGWDGDVVCIDRPDGTAVTATYDEFRRPVEITGPDGARRKYTYDACGNMLTSTDPAGAVTTHTYGEHGEPRTITDALGNRTTITTGAAGLPTAVSDPTGATERYELDPRGRVTRVTDPLGAVTTIDWGPADSPARCTYPDGTSESWATDGNGDVIAATDRNGQVTHYLRGPFHSITGRTDPDGTRHRFTHDTELRIVEVTNPQQRSWRYSYDPAGNLVQERDFNGRELRYEHDAAQRLTGLTNSADETISISRDQLGRTVEQRTGQGEVIRFVHDGAGRVISAHGPDAEVHLQRDPRGHVLTDTVNGSTTANTYDLLGRRIARTTPGGHRSEWRYDGAGLPAMLTTGAQRIEFSHDPAHHEVFRQWSPEAALASSWDTAGRLASRQIVGADAPGRGFQPRHGRSWGYRPDGAPVAVTDSADGLRRFELDGLGRVTAVDAATWSERYAYDEGGNLALSVDSRLPQDPESGRRTTAGTLVTTAGRTRYEHDVQGRLTRTVRRTLSGQQQVFAYRYDIRNRLVEARTPDGARWRYRYDPLGRRIGKARLAADGAAAEEFRFHWDGEVLAEQEHHTRQAGAQLVATTTWDHEPGTWTPVSQHHRTSAAHAPGHVIDQRFHAIITDIVGTPTELVTAGGRVEWRLRANLWGKDTGTDSAPGVDCPLRFPGQYLDRETGLHHNHHRYYDPATARYTTPDPLGLDPAPNHHGYVDNPMVLLDPLGLISRDRYQHMDRPGWSNYTLQDTNGTTYYSGLFGPTMTQADTENRHAANGNRYNTANGDGISVVPGQRTYGEARLMEQRLADRHGTVIGRDGSNYRGNRQNPMAGDKLAEYEEYETRKTNGLGCP